MLKFNVTNQTIKRTDSFEPYAGSRNYLTAEFTFSDEWTDDITAIFSHDNIHYHQLVTDGKCTVPWEVIKTPGFTVSLFCGDLVTANKVKVEVLESGFTAEGEVPGTPTPTIWEGYINTLVQKNQTIADNLESDVSANISQSVKTYTDNKAVTAQQNAQNYADSKASEALAAAINYANEQLEGKADAADVPTLLSSLTDDVGYAKKTDIASVYRAKGTIGSLSALTSLTPEVGDTYNITADIVSDTIDTGRAQDGDNIAWNGTQWDNLSGFVDLSNYTTVSAMTTAIADSREEVSDELKTYADAQAVAAVASAKEYAAGLVDANKIQYMEESEYAAAVFTSPTLIAVFPDGTLGAAE